MAQELNEPLLLDSNTSAHREAPQRLVRGFLCSSPVLRRFQSVRVFRLGIAQLVLAGLTVILATLGHQYWTPFSESLHGYWTSVFFIASGVSGILAGQHRTWCLVNATLGLSIVAALFGGVGGSISAVGLGQVLFWRQATADAVFSACHLVLYMAEVVTSSLAAHCCCAGGGCSPNTGCCCEPTEKDFDSAFSL